VVVDAVSRHVKDFALFGSVCQTSGEWYIWCDNSQSDGDSDGVGNVCDNSGDNCNSQQLDADEDGIGDVCDDPRDDGCISCGSGATCEIEC
jgi:hypothetical protein